MVRGRINPSPILDTHARHNRVHLHSNAVNTCVPRRLRWHTMRASFGAEVEAVGGQKLVFAPHYELIIVRLDAAPNTLVVVVLNKRVV